jgi:hypothetical protein
MMGGISPRDSGRTNESQVSQAHPCNDQFSQAIMNTIDKKEEKLDLQKEL